MEKEWIISREIDSSEMQHYYGSPLKEGFDKEYSKGKIGYWRNLYI